MPTYAIFLLLAIGAVSAADIDGARSGVGADINAESNADFRTDSFAVWNANKPLSRAKRAPVLGFVGTILGTLLEYKLTAFHVIFKIIDTPVRWIQNQFGEWSNYFNDETPGNEFSSWDILDLETWIFMGCLCLEMMLSASKSEIAQPSFIWFSNHYHSGSGLNKMDVNKRSIKRGGVNYFEDFGNHTKFRISRLQKMKCIKFTTTNPSKNLRDENIQADRSGQHRQSSGNQCNPKTLGNLKGPNRLKRMANDSRKKIGLRKEEREHHTPVREGTDHRKKNSAARREEIRNVKRQKVKARRMEMSNLKRPSYYWHVGKRLNISEKMRKNREKVKVQVPNRPRSGSVKRNDVRSHRSEANKKSLVHSSTKHGGRLDKEDEPHRKHENHYDSYKVESVRKRVGVAKSRRKSSFESGKESTGREKKDSKEKNHKIKMKLHPNGKKQRKGSTSIKETEESDEAHEESMSLKSGTNETPEEGESKLEKTSKSEKEVFTKKTHKKGNQKKEEHHKSRSMKETGGKHKNQSRNKGLKGTEGQGARIGHDDEEENVTKSKTKTTTKHSISGLKVSEKDSSSKHEPKVHKQKKHSKSTKKNDLETEEVENSQAQNSLKLTKSKKQGNSATVIKKSTRTINESLKFRTPTKDVSSARSSDSNTNKEIDYLSPVLGFGLANRRHLQSKSHAWSKMIHKRPMTGGYASSGRLTRALSNLYGASASAVF